MAEISEQSQMNNLRERVQSQKPLDFECRFYGIEIDIPFNSHNRR